MYQQFKNTVIMSLQHLSPEVLADVSKTLDIAGSKFEFTQKETALSVYNGALPEAVQVYLVTKKIEGLSDGTVKLYRLQLTKFFEKCRKPVNTITANDIRVFLYMYQEERHISDRTLNGLLVAIKGFFSWAAAEQYVDADPTRTIKKIKFQAKQRLALDQMELEIVRHHCKTLREKAIIEFLFSTGCRVSEAAGVKLSDIDWNKQELTVLGKGKKYRTVYLNAKAIIALKEYIASRTDNVDALFVHYRSPHKQATICTIEREVYAVAVRCTEINKPITPHIFRHTYATIMAQGGVPIQNVSRLMGHANVNTTMIYAEVATDAAKNEHKLHVV